MPIRFDEETIERLRTLSSEQVFDEVRRAVYAAGGAGSEDFLGIYTQLVDRGVLTWDQVEELEGG
jgi:hypothetical protein